MNILTNMKPILYSQGPVHMCGHAIQSRIVAITRSLLIHLNSIMADHLKIPVAS